MTRINPDERTQRKTRNSGTRNFPVPLVADGGVRAPNSSIRLDPFLAEATEADGTRMCRYTGFFGFAWS